MPQTPVQLDHLAAVLDYDPRQLRATATLLGLALPLSPQGVAVLALDVMLTRRTHLEKAAQLIVIKMILEDLESLPETWEAAGEAEGPSTEQEIEDFPLSIANDRFLVWPSKKDARKLLFDVETLTWQPQTTSPVVWTWTVRLPVLYLSVRELCRMFKETGDGSEGAGEGPGKP